jgi:hypothetical protein
METHRTYSLAVGNRPVAYILEEEEEGNTWELIDMHCNV